MQIPSHIEYVKLNDVASSLKTLKKLYEQTDSCLLAIASKVTPSAEELEKETQLLEDKDKLIFLALKTKCSDLHAISQKIDFLNTALLKEKTVSDYSLSDLLTQSIWEDCRIHC